MSDLVQDKYSSPLALWLIDLSKLLHMQPTVVKHLVESANEIESQAKEIAQLRADKERIDFMERFLKASEKKGFKWNSISFDMDRSVRDQADEWLFKEAAIDAQRAGEKG